MGKRRAGEQAGSGSTGEDRLVELNVLILRLHGKTVVKVYIHEYCLKEIMTCLGIPSFKMQFNISTRGCLHLSISLSIYLWVTHMFKSWSVPCLTTSETGFGL